MSAGRSLPERGAPRACEHLPPEALAPDAVPSDAVPPDAVPPEIVPPEIVPPEIVPPEIVSPAAAAGPSGAAAGTGRPGRGPVVDGLRLSVGTLTALPVPPPSRVDRSRAAVAMLLAPAVALVPGAAGGLTVELALRAGLGPQVTAALTVAVLALVSRGLHLDGLADTADGLAASYDRDRALAVMRRGNTGPTGAATLVIVLLVQVSALAEALGRVGGTAAVVGVLAGRATLPLMCARGIPSARPDGLGAAVAGSVPRAATAVTVLVTTAAAGGAVGLAGGPAVLGCLAVGAAGLTAALLTLRAVSRLGGITGDVLGAGVEAGTAAALVVLALG